MLGSTRTAVGAFASACSQGARDLVGGIVHLAVRGLSAVVRLATVLVLLVGFVAWESLQRFQHRP